MKKIIKRILSFEFAVMMMLSSKSAITAVAEYPNAYTDVYIDNDDSTGHSNTKTGFNTYITGSSHYRGDARTQATGYNNKMYNWLLGYNSLTSNHKIVVQMYVHLSDYSFTDPHAEYSVLCGGIGVVDSDFNQNIAPLGWSYVGSRTFLISDGWGSPTITLHSGSLKSGNVSGYTTGADGIRLYSISYAP